MTIVRYGMTCSNPYLTMVMVGRNDGYGGDFIGRAQRCLSNIFTRTDEYALRAEVIIVEYNPPPDRPGLAEEIDWSGATLPVRLITVPETVHRRLPQSDKFTMFEYIAKNVGIHRAHGEFVLSMNPDIILSGDLVARLAYHDLEDDCFYRVDRSDTRDGEVFIVHTNRGSFSPDQIPPEGQGVDMIMGIPGLHGNGAGDFTLMSRRQWHHFRGYPEVQIGRAHV